MVGGSEPSGGPGRIRSFKDLKVWQMAMTLAEECYRMTASFPGDEKFGLMSQIRRAVVSIPANIAEGYGRDQAGSFIQFLKIAQGSTRELETHLLLTERLQLASGPIVEPLLTRCERISKMLRSLIRNPEGA